MKITALTLGAFVAITLLASGQTPEPKPEPTPPQPAPAKPPEGPAPAKSDAVKPPTPAPAPAAPAPAKKRTVEDITKNCDIYNGLFRSFTDRETGSMYLFIRKDQIQREFLYFAETVDGVVGAGRNRGQFNDADVLIIYKEFQKLQFIIPNTAYYFDPDHPLARASRANTSHAVVASESIMAENKDGYLVNAGNLFLHESFLQVKQGSGGTDGKSVLGKLSESKTRFTRWGSYPKNTFFTVDYVFENPTPSRPDDDSKGLQDMADPRYVTIRIQHSLVAMPETDYQPRADDPRIGYFMTQLTDQTSLEATPYRDFIHRWHLKKKEPQAPLSEPVEPITWWIENTTPREFRETIKTAALAWNQSFEKIGYKNALVINEQPDDAKWSADDIEHNVLRWTSSPKAPFGGYGPHCANPRTGQILGADIMLEFSFVKNRVMARRLWDEIGLAGLSQDKGDAAFDPHACMAATMAQQGLLFGANMLHLRKADPVDFDTMLKESMAQLILHELGHTLGLNHNFRASQLHTPAELQNRELTEKTGLSGSVMDYMPLNLGPDKKHQGQYYINAPGPYDDWAIDYGYSDALPDAAAEAKRLNAIASRSHEPQLAFANDADDMRKAGKAIDPRAQIFDMSSDPIAYGSERCEAVQKGLEKLLTEHPKEGRSWHELTQAYVTLTSEKSNALTAISRYIGGVYVERAFVGQVKANAPDPLRPVEKEKQQAAMKALAKYAFGADSWKSSDALLRHLQQQRRGFDFRAEGEDPKIHDRVLTMQRALLDHLLHTNTQNRILDTALYGNGYPLGEMMHDLTDAILSEQELRSQLGTLRQNLQLDYVDRLINIVKNRAGLPATQSVALHELQRIEKLCAPFSSAPNPNQAHAEYVSFKIRQGLELKK
jgi:Met-zincin/Domain of unknown function (DUF5117)